jgi:hypothetical protein
MKALSIFGAVVSSLHKKDVSNIADVESHLLGLSMGNTTMTTWKAMKYITMLIAIGKQMPEGIG